MRHVTAVLISGCVLGLALGDGGCSTEPVPPPCELAAELRTDEFCSALATYYGRCGHCHDCKGKNLDACIQRGSAISEPYRVSFIACQDTMDCSDNPSHTACITRRMENAVPTTAQAQAKDAYCAACSATHAAGCESFFSVNASSGQLGTGYGVLIGGDQVAARAVTLCSSKCDPFDYGICVALISCQEAGGDFCVDSGFCAPQ